jgi:hypothetical protein
MLSLLFTMFLACGEKEEQATDTSMDSEPSEEQVEDTSSEDTSTEEPADTATSEEQ